MPNLPLDDVPDGKDEKSNKIIRNEGKIKNFNFSIKSHFELGEKIIKLILRLLQNYLVLDL